MYADQGEDQGVSEAPVTFAYGLVEAREEALEDIQAIVRNNPECEGEDVLEVFYLDDGVYGVPAKVLVPCANAALTRLRGAGYHVNLTKLAVWIPSAPFPPGDGELADALRAVTRRDGMVVVGAPLTTLERLAQDGEDTRAECAGVTDLSCWAVAGGEQFLHKYVTAKADETRQLINALTGTLQVVGLPTTTPRLQLVALGLRWCAHARFGHVLRHSYGPAVREAARLVDTLIGDALAQVASWELEGSPRLPALASLQVQMAVKKGGMGCRAQEPLAAPAFMSSWAGSLARVTRLARATTEALGGKGTAAKQFQEALTDWNAFLATHGVPPQPIDWKDW